MSKFRYCRDGLFLAACAVYAANRLLIKPLVPEGFFAWWCNDLLLIPCAAPVCLWLERRCGVRRHDDPPRAGEILFLVVLWSVLFEVAAPRWIARATGDWRDAAAYATGATFAWLWWNRATIKPSRASSAQLR
ncbi:MAG: hypothetical protein JHC52_04465 [Chthoniobacterales bacterium]|nr:hypothetical protein [Chthoniobacterales bacterium]